MIFLTVTGRLLALSRMNIVNRAMIKVPTVAAICKYEGLSCINSGPFLFWQAHVFILYHNPMLGLNYKEPGSFLITEVERLPTGQSAHL